MDYLKKILGKRPNDMTLIANDKFQSKAKELQELYPGITIYLRSDVHAKMVLIEPETVWLSSANFGDSTWFEHTIGIHDKRGYDFYRKELSRYLNIEL